MSIRVAYKGRADRRTFSEEDFTRHDVTDQGAVAFDRSNNFTADISEAAAELLKKLGEPIEVVDGQSELELDEGRSYEDMTKKELLAEIDRRNEDRDEEDHLPTSGVKADLVLVLEEDDEA